MAQRIKLNEMKNPGRPLIVPLFAVTGFDSFSKKEDYFYAASYSELDYEFAAKWFEEKYKPTGADCSSVRSGDFYGRNLDWWFNYENASYVYVSGNENGRHSSHGVAGGIPAFCGDEPISEDVSKILPFALVDGENDAGVFCNINVVHAEKGKTIGTVPTEEKTDEVCVLMLVRYILDNYTTADEAIQDLIKHVSVYTSKQLYASGLEAHFMVGDSTKTYVLEFINNEIKYQETDILTNFYLNGVEFNSDGTVYTPETQDSSHDAMSTNKVTKFGMGLERYNLALANLDSANTKVGMVELMKEKLDYRRTYETFNNPSDPFWYTELTGPTEAHGEITVATPYNDDNFQAVKHISGEKFLNRSRDQGNNGTWHTTHTSVYDLANKKLYIYGPSENGIEYEFTL